MLTPEIYHELNNAIITDFEVGETFLCILSMISKGEYATERAIGYTRLYTLMLPVEGTVYFEKSIRVLDTENYGVMMDFENINNDRLFTSRRKFVPTSICDQEALFEAKLSDNYVPLVNQLREEFINIDKVERPWDYAE